MKGKWERLVYIDLLAGPGRGVIRDTSEEFDGSPLRALKVEPAFDHLFLGDKSPGAIRALEKRIPTQDASRVTVLCGDCNEIAGQVVARLNRRTLGLAFVDPTGFEVNFRMFRTLSTRSIDVLFFFPDQIGISRNLVRFVTRSGAKMDDLMGSRAWRDSGRAKMAAGTALSSVEARDLARSWVSRFQDQMSSIGFKHFDHSEPLFTNQKNARMYHLLFFSRHAAGLRIWKNIKKIEPTGQRPLPGF